MTKVTEGLLHCEVCGEPIELIISNKVIGERKVRCICKCEVEKQEAEKERERLEECERQRIICFGGSTAKGNTFENSQDSEIMKVGKNYCKHFKEFKMQGKGLLLYGTVGTGKSHLASCIANELINQGYSALMTNFATLSNNLMATNEKQIYIESLNKYDLLIIDDLGVERKTEWMKEQVFNVIDSRIRTGKPMIITTNLTPEEIKKTTDIDDMRIYDRVLEKCHPVSVAGTSQRRQKLKKEFNEVEKKLNENLYESDK